MAEGSTKSQPVCFGITDLDALCIDFFPISANYSMFGEKIGLEIREMLSIEAENRGNDTADGLREVLTLRLSKFPALTLRDVDTALRSRTINEPMLADRLQRMYGSIDGDERHLRKCYEALFQIRGKYYNIGLQIGLSIAELDNIELNYDMNHGQCLLEVLEVRLQQSPFTWRDIVTALRSPVVNEPLLADEIARLHNFKSEHVSMEIENEDILTSKLDMSKLPYLYSHLTVIGKKYKFIGLQVGVTIMNMRDIEADYIDYDDCLLNALRVRLQQSPALTWKDVVTALRSTVVNEPGLADEIARKYVPELASDSDDDDDDENLSETEMKGLREISTQFSVTMCENMNPVELGASLFLKKLINTALMMKLRVSSESDRNNIARQLIRHLEMKIKRRPSKIFKIIEVFQNTRGLQEVGQQMMREAEKICPGRGQLSPLQTQLSEEDSKTESESYITDRDGEPSPELLAAAVGNPAAGGNSTSLAENIETNTVEKTYLDPSSGQKVTGSNGSPVNLPSSALATDSKNIHKNPQSVSQSLKPVEIEIPVIRGADIIASTMVNIEPNQPLNFHWKDHGFKVHIPAGAVSCKKTVTLCIQASLSGDYKFPDGRTLVSGVYWLSLHPYVKQFNKTVSVTLQHCALADDPTFSFITANCLQPTLPYTFMPISPGAVIESDNTTVQVDHFSAIAASASSVAYFAFCSYYSTTTPNRVYDVRITAIKNIELHVEEVKKEYDSWESGPYAITHITEESVSLSVPEVSGVPEETWEKDGWRITPVVNPPTLEKGLIEEHRKGQLIPHFSLKLRLKDPNHPSPLEQCIRFTGVTPPTSISLTRDPSVSESVSQSLQPSQSPTETPVRKPTQPLISPLDSDDLFDVISELKSVEARWKHIGRALRLKSDTLKVIERDNKESSDCLTEVLTLWLNKNYNYQRFGEPSWELLADAVKHPAGGNNTALADEIRARHC